VEHSTFSDHFVEFFGGGVFVGPGCEGSLDHSTLSGNSAFQGGGIYTAGTLSVDHSTVTENSATAPLFAGAGGASSFAKKDK
jgi:predicted outer membrane repeat protein